MPQAQVRYATFCQRALASCVASTEAAIAAKLIKDDAHRLTHLVLSNRYASRVVPQLETSPDTTREMGYSGTCNSWSQSWRI